MKKMFICSAGLFSAALIALTGLTVTEGLTEEKGDTYNYEYLPEMEDSNGEKTDYYNVFEDKINYLRYAGDYFEYNHTDYSDEMKEEIVNFDENAAFSAMDKISGIKITEMEKDGAMPVEIYTDRENKGFSVLKNDGWCQFYKNSIEKPKKYLDLINEIEEKNSLIYTGGTFSKETDKLAFRNMEMNLIFGESSGIIYLPSYNDLKFECENLPLEIIYTLKDGAVDKAEAIFVNIGEKDISEYKIDKSMFYRNEIGDIFTSVYKERKSAESESFKGDFKGIFNMGNGYKCGFVTITGKK